MKSSLAKNILVMIFMQPNIGLVQPNKMGINLSKSQVWVWRGNGKKKKKNSIM